MGGGNTKMSLVEKRGGGGKKMNIDSLQLQLGNIHVLLDFVLNYRHTGVSCQL